MELTDYESIKERLDACVFWLHSYPEKLQKCVAEKTKKIDEAKLLTESRTNNADKIAEYEKKMEYYQKCYEEERKLQYVAVPDEILEDGFAQKYIMLCHTGKIKKYICRFLQQRYPGIHMRLIWEQQKEIFYIR